MRRFHINPKLKLGSIIYFGAFLLIGFYIEILYPGLNTMYWSRFVPEEQEQGEKPLRILLVADPQLIGEMDEMKYIGAFSRWDSDRYLHIHYQAAFNYLLPDLVIFLGDIFDEGTKASGPQRNRYYQRFRNIFSIQRNQQAKYIFIPGDNDIGGERERIYPEKVSYFNDTFGDIQKPYVYNEGGHDLQFLKVIGAGVGYSKYSEIIRKLSTPKFRIVVTHNSCLQRFSEPCLSVLNDFSPDLILSGHSHKSTYYRITKSDLIWGRPEYFKEFLNPQSKSEFPHSKKEPFESQLQIDLKSTTSQYMIHEITVPTCSYRMGVSSMGYGAMQLYKNGTMNYTVLWLPSRFHQLYIYLGFYIISKLIVYPWITWKILGFVWTYLVKLRTSWNRRSSSVSKYIKV